MLSRGREILLSISIFILGILKVEVVVMGFNWKRHRWVSYTPGGTPPPSGGRPGSVNSFRLRSRYVPEFAAYDKCFIFNFHL